MNNIEKNTDDCINRFMEKYSCFLENQGLFWKLSFSNRY